VIAAVSAYGLHSFIPNPWAEVYWLRASLVSCEAVLVSLPWFFHRDLLFQVQIPGLPEKRILSTPSREFSKSFLSNDLSVLPSDAAAAATAFPLPWSSYVRLLSAKRTDARAFYEAEALRSGWSVRQLNRQIESRFYERIALSKNKTAMLTKAQKAKPGDPMTPEEAIKDPFVLEFLDLKDEYSESDLEEALIQRLADFLLELGDDFAFLGQQQLILNSTCTIRS